MYNAYKVVLNSIINTLYDLLNNILFFLEKLDSLPEILVNLGLAILTILIPLAIAILTDYFQKRKDTNIPFAKLDLHVVLDRVFKIRWLFFYVLLIFLPLSIWEGSAREFKLIELVISIIGLFFTSRIIFHVYEWTKGNEYKYRFLYLKKLKDPEELAVVYHSIWQTQNTPLEREFLDKFVLKLDQLLEKHEKE